MLLAARESPTTMQSERLLQFRRDWKESEFRVRECSVVEDPDVASKGQQLHQWQVVEVDASKAINVAPTDDGVIVGDDNAEEAHTLPLDPKSLVIATNFTNDKLTLEQMFYKNDACPLEAAHEMHYCAAQGMDHTQCCERSGVANTAAGGKCLTFCDQRPNRFTTLDTSYLPCYDVFENMKRCFFVEIRRKAEAKFGGKVSYQQTHDKFGEF
ncbi:DB module [Teladorsagia circumcincta]|uniref:DB module n=1 Tax=Teladorsagia circumcincta TaxID=45464 RepID=A0A2G9UDY7_TELCI|nr:DB module [Teladorsagia circumcincta]